MRDIQPIARHSALSAEELVSLCVRCGKCLSVCPTYSVFPLEPFSPRGRLELIGAALHREISPKCVLEAVATCLLCGRCEGVCDLEIPTTDIVAHIRHKMSAASLPDATESAVRLLFSSPAAQRRILKLVSELKRFLPAGYKGGLVYRLLGLDSRISDVMRELKRDTFTELHSRKLGAKTALFVGCAINHLFHDIGTSSLALLERAGIAVDVPDAQACCGLILWAVGDEEGARKLAELNLDALGGYEAVVFPCRSCSYAFRKLYPQLLGTDGERLAERVRDMAEVMAESAKDGEPPRNAEKDVEFHIPCHAELSSDERRFLKELGMIAEDKGCCGGGGSFGFKYSELSRAIAEGRMQRRACNHMVTDCMGCYIQLKYLRPNMAVDVESLCEWLREKTKTR